MTKFRTEIIGPCTLYLGDCREVLADIRDVHACVTDPPYHLTSVVKRFGKNGSAPAQFGTDGAYARACAGFMGQTWDGGDIAFRPETWALVWAALSPGGHLTAFSGTRTYHRMACAIEDAGFELRDMLAWLYGSGFPKSHDVAKHLDKTAGHWRVRANGILSENGSMSAPNYGRTDKGQAITEEAQEWEGFGTALKPALEPIALARKPLIGTVAENVQEHGSGALNIDAVRVGENGGTRKPRSAQKSYTCSVGGYLNAEAGGLVPGLGRWPANVITDGSLEVLGYFPLEARDCMRFFYAAKASKEEREFGLDAAPIAQGSDAALRDGGRSGMRANHHPTVKPLSLMRWLCRLVTPPSGVVLDPFLGSGSTGMAAAQEGFRFIGIEREEAYFDIACGRIEAAVKQKAETPDMFTQPDAYTQLGFDMEGA